MRLVETIPHATAGSVVGPSAFAVGMLRDLRTRLPRMSGMLQSYAGNGMRKREQWPDENAGFPAAKTKGGRGPTTVY